jgi:hypothetical protein
VVSQGKVWQGNERQCNDMAWHVKERQGMESHGKTSQVMSWYENIRHGLERKCKERNGKVRHAMAWKGKARHGIEMQGCWLWSLIIFMIHWFVSVVFGPHSIMRGVGGIPPPQLSSGGSKGVATIFVAPP